MALKKTVTTVHGFQAENAYHRVEGISFKSKTEIDFQIRSYIDNSGKFPHFADIAFSCAYDINKGEPFAQAYEYLKSTVAFSDAVDC